MTPLVQSSVRRGSPRRTLSTAALAVLVSLLGMALARADGEVSVAFASQAVGVEEGGAPAEIYVILSDPLPVTVKIPFTVSKGWGVTKEDFSISASPVVIPAGSTTGTIRFTTKQDFLV